MEFISPTVKSIIKNGLTDLYQNLNPADFNILNDYMIKIIEVLYYQNNLNKDDFEYQLTQNNYKDVKWLSTFLLPYLNADPSELRSFTDLYTQKISDQDVDINKSEPLYKFTNLQYGRCNRDGDFSNIKCTEIPFDKDHLEHNFKLFIQTLVTSSNKLYVNWLNIIPVSYSDIDTNKTYTNTLNIYTTNKYQDVNFNDIATKPNLSNDDKLLLGSLYIGDIYNTIRNYLYEDIKDIKLLLFDIVIFPSRRKATAISVLNEIFHDNDIFLLNDALNNIGWNSQSSTNQRLFSEIWDNLLKAYSTDTAYVVKPITNYSVDNVQDLSSSSSYYTLSTISLKRLIKGICINFDKRYGSKKNVLDSGYFTIKTADDDDDIDEDNLDEFNFSNMDRCLKSIKPEFMYNFFTDILQQFKTTYYGTKLLSIDKKQILEAIAKEITVKNVYNFAKSFSSYVNNKRYTQYNKYWCSLEDKEKKIILDRLNLPDSRWFNIKGYFKSLLDAGFNSDKKNVDTLNDELYVNIKQIIIKIVFETLIFKGILSKYEPNRYVSDETFTAGKRLNELIAYKYFNKSSDNKYAENAYYYLTDLPYLYSGELFDILAKDSWYSMQAMEWVSQLGFCHHYINNRISYVTGATGVGKSTHVPKLYMYYLKAIDYKSVGKVVCTQPRRTPTERNAEEVSKQLGVPIVQLNDKGETFLDDTGAKVDLEYYNVQMQHQDKKHVKNIQQLVLKFVTDGSLLQEFKSALPICKKMSFDNKRATLQNLYDVIIIDEAHEHNKNMDLLLTLLKLYGYYNPSIRVVILSATIDEDEPNYRRYYRLINDNLKYPYDMWIKNNNIDRINVDRRFHISAPGTGTRFTVGEIYKPGYDAVQLIKELIETRKGDILVFQPGEADIIKLIEELNKPNIMPDTWIALPFYSTMKADRRSFIESIDYTFPSLRIDKEDDFDKVKSLEDGNSDPYTNFVLIATNIAEASITIKRLYYVIDTGTRKSNYYYYKKRNNKLLLTTISETSRVQRKGRVGRTGQGEAYFLYKKGITAENKTPYEISISNIGSDIYTRLCNRSGEDKFSIDKYYDNLKIMFETSSGRYNYIGNPKHNDYKFEEYIPDFYETGFSIDDLLDNTGRFYIVHPEELFLKRNIFGKIVDVTSEDIKFDGSKDDGIIKSSKLNSFIEDFNTTNFYKDNSKTELGINITDMMEKLKFDNLHYARVLIYSILLKSSDKIAMAITLLNNLRGDLTRIFTVDEKFDTPLVKVLQNNDKTSDIEVLIDICEKFFMYISRLSPKLDLKYIVTEMKGYESQIKYKGNDVNVDAMIKVYEEFKDYEDTELERDDIIDALIRYLNVNLKDKNLVTYINEFCRLHNINPQVMTNIISPYLKLKDTLQTFYYDDKRGKSFKKFIEEYTSRFENDYDHTLDRIKLPFILSQPYNLAYPITGTESYLSLYYPVVDNIVGLGKLKIMEKGRRKYINSILFNNMYAHGICYYDSYNSDRDMISNVMAINKDYIKLYKSIYNRDRIEEIVEKYVSKIDKFIERIKGAQQFKAPIPKDYSVIAQTKESYEQLLRDIQ